MKKNLMLGISFLLVVLFLAMFTACDIDGDSTLKGIYFNLDPEEIKEDHDYYFIGYNTTTGSSYSAYHSVMVTATPGVFFTEDILNLGDWVWAIYEVIKNYPSLVDVENHEKLVQGEELPQMLGLQRCQVNILITLTQNDIPTHTLKLKECAGILVAPEVKITGTATLGNVLSANYTGSIVASSYQWMVSVGEEGVYAPLQNHTDKTLDLNKGFLDSMAQLWEDTVYVRVEVRNASGETETLSDPISISVL